MRSYRVLQQGESQVVRSKVNEELRNAVALQLGKQQLQLLEAEIEQRRMRDQIAGLKSTIEELSAPPDAPEVNE